MIAESTLINVNGDSIFAKEKDPLDRVQSKIDEQGLTIDKASRALDELTKLLEYNSYNSNKSKKADLF